MGKVLRQNIMKIFNALGVYAFPEGKPTLNWGSTVINHSINVNGVTGLTISDVEVDGTSVGSLPLQVVDGKSLSFKLNLPNNLYIYDAVAIRVGGVDITNNTGVWDESTGVVNIAAVTDEVIITAAALTYVGYGESDSPLVSMFDGLNRGGTTGQWKDKQEPNRVLTLDNCTENTDNVQFNGTDSTAFCTNSSYNKIAVKPEDGTIEAVVSGINVDSSNIMTVPVCNGYGENERLINLVLYYSTAGSLNKVVCGFCQMKSTESSSSPSYTLPLAWTTPKSSITTAHLSVSDARAYLDGAPLSRSAYFSGSKSHTNSKCGVISDYNASGNLRCSAGKMYCVRIYSRQLTDDEVAQNYKVDQKRFNLT